MTDKSAVSKEAVELQHQTQKEIKEGR